MHNNNVGLFTHVYNCGSYSANSKMTISQKAVSV